MHHRASIILGPKMVNLVEVVLEEVELHPGLDVAPVDGDVLVPVRPALLVPEPGGVHQLVHHDPRVDAAIAQAHLLRPARSAHTAAASTALHDVDVTLLIGPRDKSYAGLLMVVLHSPGNDASFMAVKTTRDDIGDDTSWPFPPTISDSVPACFTLDRLL